MFAEITTENYHRTVYLLDYITHYHPLRTSRAHVPKMGNLVLGIFGAKFVNF